MAKIAWCSPRRRSAKQASTAEVAGEIKARITIPILAQQLFPGWKPDQLAPTPSFERRRRFLKRRRSDTILACRSRLAKTWTLFRTFGQSASKHYRSPSTVGSCIWRGSRANAPSSSQTRVGATILLVALTVGSGSTSVARRTRWRTAKRNGLSAFRKPDHSRQSLCVRVDPIS
jgi:hypothetical protein